MRLPIRPATGPFAGTQKIAPGGHSLRVDQIDDGGKVLSRVELPFVREDASRVAEMNAPETQPAAQPEPQKTVEAEQPAPAAPEATVTAETEAPKPTDIGNVGGRGLRRHAACSQA